MGEMACYTERCPDCGRIPPGRKKQKPPDLLKRLKNLSVKKQGKPTTTGVMMLEAGLRTNKITLREIPVRKPENFESAKPLPKFREKPIRNGNTIVISNRLHEDSAV